MKKMLHFYRFKHFSTYLELIHLVTTKDSSAPYGFSLALHTGESQSDILDNRKKLAKSLGNDNIYFIVADQTHSDHIKIIDQSATRGWESSSDAIEDCDALITDLPHVALTILTADCVPILLYDPIRNIVAAVHAGWKGSKAEIVKQTVKKMVKRFHSNPSDIKAGIAPSIGACCYEVGREVAEHFFDTPHACISKINDKFMLDLPQINKQQLLEAGLKEKNIEMSHICTACDVEHYFSYRKEQGCSGRFMSMIGLK